MVGWHHRLNGHGFGWTPGVGDGQGDLVCCGSWGCKESDTTERLSWTKFSRPREMLWISLQSYFRWSLLRITYEDSALGVSWTCGQADLHGQKTFGAELWKLSAGSFLWAVSSVREGDIRGWQWHLAGRKEGAVGNIFILNYLLIIQEKFSACLPHAQVFSSRATSPQRMDSPWLRPLSLLPRSSCSLPRPSTLPHRSHSWAPLRGKHDTPEGTEGGVPPPLNSVWALPLCGLWVAPLMTACLLDFVLPSLIHNSQSGSILPVDKDDRYSEQQQHLGD